MSDTTKQINELLARFHAGDPAAKKALIDRAYNRLLVLARNHLRRYPGVRKEQETGDVLNETIVVRLYRALDAVFLPSPPPNGSNQHAPAATCRGPNPPTKADFFAIAAQHIRFQLQDLAKKGKRSRNPLPPPVPIRPPDTDGVGVDPPAPGCGLSNVGKKIDIDEAIEQLTEVSRRAFDLLYYNGLTIEEAAAVEGLSYDQMKRRWLTARRELGCLLKAYRPADTPSESSPG